jgi:hypothetical protein
MQALIELGLFPALQDYYHELTVVLDREADVDEWFGHP